MSKKPRFKIPLDTQHAKSCQTLLISARKQFYHFLPSLWSTGSWKVSFLLIFEILGLFGSTLTADEKNSLRNSENLGQPLQMHLSNNQKNLFPTFCFISKVYFNFLKIFKKR